MVRMLQDIILDWKQEDFLETIETWTCCYPRLSCFKTDINSMLQPKNVKLLVNFSHRQPIELFSLKSLLCKLKLSLSLLLS